LVERIKRPKPEPEDSPWHIPAFCRISQEKRNQSWITNPPKAMPIAQRTLEDQAQANKIAKELSEKKLTRPKNMKKLVDSSEDHSHQRWDARRNKWVSLTTQENEMKTKSGATAVNKKGEKLKGAEKSEPKKADKPVAKKKAAAKKSAAKSNGNGAAPHKRGEGPRPGSKMEIIHGLLTRKKGCTVADILEATSWPSISVPATAELLGLKLKKEKAKGERTRYFGS